MPSLSYDSSTVWSNYHLTSGTIVRPDLEPRVQVEQLGRIHMADVMGDESIARFRATAATLSEHIANHVKWMVQKQQLNQLGNPPMPIPVGLAGRGWSFSNIIGADKGKRRETQLMLDGLAGAIMLPREDLHENAAERAGRLALVSGGTRLRELVNWAEPLGLSIRTSGTHLGASIAGAAATASHGSRLGFGGIQNMIAGIHFVTGMGEDVWVERASAPVLNAAAANRLSIKPEMRIISNDDVFEDALVHFGCLGIVNCVAMELVPDARYDMYRCDRPVDDAWLAKVSAGDWRGIAQWLGRDEDPVFYEATLNPHDWSGASGLHSFYFPASTEATESGESPGTVADALAAFAETFSVSASALADAPLLDPLPEIEVDLTSDDQIIDVQDHPANMRVFDPRSSATSAYEYYARNEGFATTPSIRPALRWGQIHKDEITFGSPGSLYNASFAIRREDVARAIPLLARAVRNLPRSFVFTLRFVSNPAGSLAFTRFPETAVIEIDGLSPWICRRVLRDRRENTSADIKMLKYLMYTLPTGARLMANALEDAGIGYSNHFAKRSFIDRAKTERDFGPLTNPQSRLTRWRRTREAVLGNDIGRAIFWNWGANNLGIVGRPTQFPEIPMPGGAGQ